MEKYFGFAKEVIEKGFAFEEDSYGENNLYDLNITDTADFSFYLNLAEQRKEKILDIGCGTGRILQHLMKNGYESIIGMDLSQHMLQLAKKKLSESGFAAILVEGDMRDFSIDDEFSLIIIPNCSMIYIDNDEDRRRVFQSVYRHLQPGGIFAFDFDAEVVPVGETRPWLSSQAIHPATGEVVLSTVQIKGIHKELRLMNMVNYRYKTNNLAKITVNTSLEATCNPNRMIDLIKSEGFFIKGVYGDYNYSPYEGGELCVIVAEKK